MLLGIGQLLGGRGSTHSEPGDGAAPLDGLSVSPLVAYSSRKLSSSYMGSALRVRRSSDNAEQDIGFSGADLDTAALIAFCGAGNGFVAKWYDQSGNARDVAQTNASSQPQIVAAGVLVTKNDKPTLNMASGGANLESVDVADWLGVSSYSLSCVSSLADATTPNGHNMIGLSSSDTPYQGHTLAFCIAPQSGFNFVSIEQWGDNATFYNLPLTTDEAVWLATKNGASGSELFLNGASRGTDMAPVNTLTSLLKLRIGANWRGAFGGAIAEAIVFGTAISSADHALLVQDQCAHFGVSYAG